MKLQSNSNHHLTYCSNIHPGESWEEVKEQLKLHLPQLKNRISPGKDFGVGLRLSAKAAEQLLRAGHLSQFKKWLDQEGLYVFTINGFPYGNFHRQRVKDLVYTPDWRRNERLQYSRMLIAILAELLPEGMEGSISTSPISYKYWLSNSLKQQAFRQGSRALAKLSFELAQLRKQQGKEIHIDIEPEPDCLLENTRETVDFFSNYLFPAGSAFLGDQYDVETGEAEEMIRRHIGVCYDTCHFAVEYENPAEAVLAFKEAGIRIGKTQISAALKVELDQKAATREQIANRLSRFNEPTYLHQVVERSENRKNRQFRDLPQALPHIYSREATEWRIHFHVPIFTGRFEFLQSTRAEIMVSLEEIMAHTGCCHFEIETYTWEVLPENLKVDLSHSIEREYEWVQKNLKKEEK